MDFIMNIYNSQYFTIGIFIVIAVLALIFLILLLSGGKKKKKAKQENIAKQENEINNNLNQDVLNATNGVASNNMDVNTIDSINDNAIDNVIITPDMKSDNINPITNNDQNMENNNIFNSQMPPLSNDIGEINQNNEINSQDSVLNNQVNEINNQPNILNSQVNEIDNQNINDTNPNSNAFSNNMDITQNPIENMTNTNFNINENTNNEINSTENNVPEVNSSNKQVENQEVKSEVKLPSIDDLLKSANESSNSQNQNNSEQFSSVYVSNKNDEIELPKLNDNN